MARFYYEAKNPQATVAGDFDAAYIDAADEKSAKAELERRGVRLHYIEEVVE